MNDLLVILIVCSIIIIALSCTAYFTKKEERKYKERRISYIKENIKEEFETITHYLNKDTIDWLNECADKLRKMSTDKDIIDNVKPYDEFKLDNPKKYGYDSFKIKLDRNLVPKFAPGEHCYFVETDKIDYELEACMDLKELEVFIERCKMIYMCNEIETLRKKIVEDKLK